MQDSTEDRRIKKSQCIDSQERMVKELFSAIVDTKMLSGKLTELHAIVNANDKKHTESINALRDSFTAQNTIVLENLAAFKNSFDHLSSRVGPYVEKAEGAKSLIQKWSPWLCVALLGIMAFGEKADKLIELLIKVVS